MHGKHVQPQTLDWRLLDEEKQLYDGSAVEVFSVPDVQECLQPGGAATNCQLFSPVCFNGWVVFIKKAERQQRRSAIQAS